MPRKQSVGPMLVAFGGVVVDDVEDHLEPGGVQRLHHRLELVDRCRRASSAASGAK